MDKKNTQEIHEWTCPKCGKVIKSLYEEQFDQMKAMHEYTHKKGESKEHDTRKP